MTLYRRGAQLLFCPSNIENARGCSCMTGNYGARTHAILSGASSLLLLRLLPLLPLLLLSMALGLVFIAGPFPSTTGHKLVCAMLIDGTCCIAKTRNFEQLRKLAYYYCLACVAEAEFALVVSN